MLEKKKSKGKSKITNLRQANHYHRDGAYHFFAVFDGHGSSGKEASNTASDLMTGYLDRHKEKVIMFKKDAERVKFIH